MNANLQIVNRYFDLTSPKGRSIDSLLPQIGELLGEGFIFSSPMMTIQGRNEYLQLLGQFLKTHESFIVHKQFASEDNVCATTELTVNAPDGSKVKMNLAEIFTIKLGKIVAHEIYYDPTAFAKAFGMSKEQ